MDDGFWFQSPQFKIEPGEDALTMQIWEEFLNVLTSDLTPG